MDAERERVLGLAERICVLRRAAASSKSALEYVRRQLTEAEAAFDAGLTTTRRADRMNGRATQPSATAANGKTRKGEISQRVAAAFADGAVHTPSELRDQLGLSPPQLKKCLPRLIRNGVITKRGLGRYVLAKRGASATRSRRSGQH